jgi:hypothetical protein
MSVMEIDPKTFGRVAVTLLASHHADRYARCVFDHHEDASIRVIWGSSDPGEFAQRYDKAKRSMILNWVNRLSLANQIAVVLNYYDGDEITLRHLPDGIEHSMPYTASELYETLNSIQYNLYTNAGRCMFSHEDMDRLTRLIGTAAHLIIEER